MLRQLQQRGANTRSEQEKLKNLPMLEEGEAECRTRRNLSPEEKANVTEEKRSEYEQHLRELEEQEKMAPRPPPPELGVLRYPIDAKILGDGLYPPTSSWRGYVNGELITTAGSALIRDPLQGVVFIANLEVGISTSKTYPTPRATGPVKIVAESNGVLTLKSVAGTYEVYHKDTNTRESVKVPGGTTYYFDVKTRTFR